MLGLEPIESGGKAEDANKGLGSLLIAGRNRAPLLEPCPEPLHVVAIGVDPVRAGDLFLVALRTHAQLRATCGVLWRAWSDGVVPLRVELVALDIEARHLLVANLDPLRIAPRVQHAVHCQPARRRGRGNQIHDGRMADERTASPILGDVAEQAMLDLVPLRGSGWIVADRDR